MLTNLLLPYALTQMTDDGMPSSAAKRMDPDAVAPVLTALASPDCRLNGEYIVTGGGRLIMDTIWPLGFVAIAVASFGLSAVKGRGAGRTHLS